METTQTSSRRPRALTWTDRGHNVRTAVTKLCWGADPHQPARSFEVALRLDGRGGDGYRVDVLTASWLPWEAIDGGVPVPTLRVGRELCRAWLAAAAEQRTLTPTLPRREPAEVRL